MTETVGLAAGHTDVSLWYVVPGDRAAALVFDGAEVIDVRWFPFTEVPFEGSDHLSGGSWRNSGGSALSVPHDSTRDTTV